MLQLCPEADTGWRQWWRNRRNIIVTNLMVTTLWTKHHYRTLLRIFPIEGLLPSLNLVYIILIWARISSSWGKLSFLRRPACYVARHVNPGYTVGTEFCLKISFVAKSMVNWSLFKNVHYKCSNFCLNSLYSKRPSFSKLCLWWWYTDMHRYLLFLRGAPIFINGKHYKITNRNKISYIGTITYR